MKKFILTCLFIFIAQSSHALVPDEILVIANINAAGSKGLAAYYMKKRQIPEKNIVKVFITDKESCSRDAYEKKIIPPVRRALEKNPDIRALVTMYGMPLRILSPGFTPEEESKIERLEKKIASMKDELENKDIDNSKDINKKISRINKEIRQIKQVSDKTASFDSELMLVKKKEYNLNFWLKNPYFMYFTKQSTPVKKSEVLMVSRLDGADADVVRRIIDDSIEAEKEGLTGTAYFDARWKDPGDKKKKSGYGLYDQSIHKAAKIISEKSSLQVVVDDTEALFNKGECPNTALYCGWYSLAKYIDAFTWQKGSVGFHIASAECATLKHEKSRVWCKKMLDKGIAATVGPVGEPYVSSFPMPEIFFGLLAQGHLTLAESYLVSLPFLSWKMVLVGDPLYRVNIKKKAGPI